MGGFQPAGRATGASLARPLLIAAVALGASLSAPAAGFFDFLKSKPAPGQTSSVPSVAMLSGLSQDQIVSGLKEALGNGVKQAVAGLGKPDGFLSDLSVKIPMPQSLQTVEKTLRALRQDALADSFVTTLNRAAEKAVPEAAEVLAGAVMQMSIADAKAVLAGSNNAATQYFRHSSESNLFARFHPIVKNATDQTGVTRAYKQMTDKAALANGFGLSLLNKDTTDLDSYVTRKALDGLFLKIAAEEKRIRETPAARTTALLQKVFGAAAK